MCTNSRRLSHYFSPSLTRNWREIASILVLPGLTKRRRRFRTWLIAYGLVAHTRPLAAKLAVKRCALGSFRQVRRRACIDAPPRGPGHDPADRIRSPGCGRIV